MAVDVKNGRAETKCAMDHLEPELEQVQVQLNVGEAEEYVECRTECRSQ